MVYLGSAIVDQYDRVRIATTAKKPLKLAFGDSILFFEDPDGTIRICKAPDKPTANVDPLLDRTREVAAQVVIQ